MATSTDKRYLLLWQFIFMAGLIWSGFHPKDTFTWFLEVLPAGIGWLLLRGFHARFPTTPLVQWLILVHMLILMVGGHYTYAEVPLFDDVARLFHWERNNYDRVGHFAQGFVPALITREILWRKSPLRNSAWLPWVILAFCLSFSALYELFEWGVAVSSGESADAFLGTQGDVWDTQKDMFLCLVGASVSLIVLSRLHTRQLRNISSAGKHQKKSAAPLRGGR